jgi:hypothetical protein
VIKASAVVADSRAMHYLQEHQIRLLRAIGSSIGSGPSHFHFNKLTPNYDDFWESDSDGAVSFTPFEVYLWFKTRGDTCVNCPPESTMIFRDPYLDGMVIQVNKAPAPATGG